MAKHNELVGASLHVPGFIQSSDPGAVGAGVLWVDTTTPTAPIFKIRNAADTGWTTSTVGASALTGLSDITITSPSNGEVLTYDSGTSKWKNAAGGGGGGGSSPYPFATPGSPDGNNDEFDGTLGGWTVQQDVSGSNSKDVNTGNNSRLIAHMNTASGDELRLAKTLSGTWTGDISVTASVGLGSYAAFATCEFGFLASGLNSGFLAVVNNDGSMNIRSYSNWSSNTQSALVTSTGVFPVDKKCPVHLYVHLQRVSGTWSLWVSRDGSSWAKLGTSGSSLTVVGGALRLAGFGATAGYTLSSDFVRYNWLFL